MTDDDKKNLIFFFVFLLAIFVLAGSCNYACNARKEVIVNYKKEIKKIREKRREAYGERCVENNSNNFTVSPLSGNIREEIYQRYQKFYKIQRGPIALNRLASYDATIKKVASEYGIDSDLIYGIAAIESNGRRFKKGTKEPITSRAGAIGLMQIMPTHKKNRVICRKFGVRELDLGNPTQNLYVGGFIYNNYRGRMNNDTMLGLVAYNWGPNRDILKTASSFSSVHLQLPKKVKSYALSVMAVTLMKKVKDKHGQILPYTGNNIKKIQAIPLPGIN